MITNGWTRALVVMVGGALLLAAAGEARAHDRMGRLKESLNLTDEQVTAIREVFVEAGPTQRQLFQALRQAQGELRQLALNGGDEAAVQQKTAEISGLMAQGLQRPRRAAAEDRHDPHPGTAGEVRAASRGSAAHDEEGHSRPVLTKRALPAPTGGRRRRGRPRPLADRWSA